MTTLSDTVGNSSRNYLQNCYNDDIQAAQCAINIDIMSTAHCGIRGKKHALYNNETQSHDNCIQMNNNTRQGTS